MRRGGEKEEEKVMGPLFPRLHVNDTVKGGPRAPPRNKMALYEQFSVPSSQRFAAGHGPRGAGAGSSVPSTSASQVGGNDRPLFPSFCVPGNEPVRPSEQTNANSISRQPVNSMMAQSGRQSSQLKSKDANTAGLAAECSSQRREDSNFKNSSRKKLTIDDDFMVPSIFCSGVPLHLSQENAGVQEKLAPFSTSANKSVSSMSKTSAKCSNGDKRHLEGTNVSDVRSRNSPRIKEKEPAQTLTNVETKEKDSSFQASKEKLRKTVAEISSYRRDQVSSINISDKPRSGTNEYQAKSGNQNAIEIQNPPKARSTVSAKPCTDTRSNDRTLLEQGLREESGVKRKRSVRHQDVDQKDDSSDSSVDSLPGLEISPDDVVGAIGPKHFWKARRAIVNQQRVFAVQVFELHRLIKVQKLIAASPRLLIEGDPCLGTLLATSKSKLAEGNLKRQLSLPENNDDMQPTLQQPENSKENTEANQLSPSPDDGFVGSQHDQAAMDGTFNSNPPALPAAPDNKQNNWHVQPPQNQWLVPLMSPSEGLIYKPYTGPCRPPGSFLAPYYANYTPLSLPSTAGDFMNSAYGVPIPHQPQHMVVPGPPPMPPMYFPPFSLPIMNPVASASAVEQVSHHATSQPNGHIEQHSRSSCNMPSLRSEAFSGGIWRFHASRDSERQGSSASSPLDRHQGDEGRGPVPIFPAASVGNGQPQPSSSSQENHGRVIRVVPHNALTASESAARIFRSIQMEREQNDL